MGALEVSKFSKCGNCPPFNETTHTMNTSTPFVSRSQAGQDQFVWEILEHKENGFYVDLGCHDTDIHSNTRALEDFGWTGLLVDVLDGVKGRKGTFIKCDATNPNDSLKVNYAQLPTVVDYLSLDTDDALMGTFVALPWDSVTFRTITLETDVYRIGPKVRDQTRSLLRAMGYYLCCGDVVVEWPQGTFVPYEDFWVMPELVNPELVRKYQCDGKFWWDILK